MVSLFILSFWSEAEHVGRAFVRMQELISLLSVCLKGGTLDYVYDRPEFQVKFTDIRRCMFEAPAAPRGL